MKSNTIYKLLLCVMLLVFMYVSAACSISNDDKDEKNNYSAATKAVDEGNYIVKIDDGKESFDSVNKSHIDEAILTKQK